MAGVSNHYDIMSAIKTVIDGLALPGFPVALIQPILNYKVPDLTTPIVLIAPWGSEDVLDYMVDTDEIIYKTGLAIVCADETVNPLETLMGWRQSIRRRLNNRPVAGLSNALRYVAKPGPVVEPGAWLKDKKLVSTMVIQVEIGEARS